MQGRGGAIDFGWKFFDGPLDNDACSQKCLADPECGFMVTFDTPKAYCSLLKVNAPCDGPLDHAVGQCGNSGAAAVTAKTYYVSRTDSGEEGKAVVVARARSQPQLLPWQGGQGCCHMQGRGGAIDFGWKFFDGPLDNDACSQKCLADPECGFMVTFDTPKAYCSLLKVNAPCDAPLDH